MNEPAALDVTAVRAVETNDGDRTVWTDADREWASRAAAAVVGEGADGETFLARRSALALERIGTRDAAVPRAVRALRWRPWVGVAVVAAAFVAGVVVDRVGGGTRINLLAPPVFALLVWNLAVYLVLVVRLVVRPGRFAQTGPLRAALTYMAAGGERARRIRGDGAGPMRAAVGALPAEWARLAAPLYAARSARILHLAAAAVALGVIAGLYVRGLAFEYRATWESTFLDAGSVQALLAVALTPGSLLTGIAVPDVAAIEAIRAPASENAARWLHLFAATVAAVVVAPRLVLAAVAGLIERRRARHVAVPLSDPYYQRLLRGYRGGPVRVRVIPYSYTPAPPVLAGLEALLGRAYGGSASLVVEAPVSWGDEEAVAARRLPGGHDPVVALFSLTATPEHEAHGRFLEALTAEAGAERPFAAVVDESAFHTRWPGDERRLAGRRAAWRDLLTVHHADAVFADLTAPDLAEAQAALDAALDAARPAAGAGGRSRKAAP